MSLKISIKGCQGTHQQLQVTGGDRPKALVTKKMVIGKTFDYELEIKAKQIHI